MLYRLCTDFLFNAYLYRTKIALFNFESPASATMLVVCDWHSVNI